MDFGANKTPIEVIKEGAFGKTFLEIFMSMLMAHFTKNCKKNLLS